MPLARWRRSSYLGAFAPPARAPIPYKVKIDRRMCIGYGDCVGIAPEVFRLGDDNVVVVMDPEGADDETILDPVDAITVIDEVEEQVWPA